MTELDVIDPATGEQIGSLPVSNAPDLVGRSRTAFESWSRMPAGERASLLKAGARRLHLAIEEIAYLQTREGVPVEGDRGRPTGGQG